MSTNQRFVPVKLIAGKEYVLRNGRHVYVKDNPHWQCAAKFPFVVMQGPDFIVYFTPEGQADPAGGENEYDIIRPVYKKGEVYRDRDGARRVITLDDNSSAYPLEDEACGSAWTRDGRVDRDEVARVGDLMDYEHPPAAFAPPAPPLPVFNPVGIIPIPPPAPVDPWIGKRVKFNHHGISGYGKVVAKSEDGLDYAVEVEDAPPGCHQCCGLVPSGHGWFVLPFAMSEAPVAEDPGTQPTFVISVPAMPELAPIEALPSLVGARVEVSLDRHLARGVVKYEDGGLFAIELDTAIPELPMHDCGGHCKVGRGWWVSRDELREVVETPAEAPVDAESSEPLTEVDVIEVWGAYRINPTIDIESWIAARRKLKAAAK